jgi:hypothetical protein
MTVPPTVDNQHVISELLAGLLLSLTVWSGLALWLAFKLPFVSYLPPVSWKLRGPAIFISVAYVVALWFGLFFAT